MSAQGPADPAPHPAGAASPPPPMLCPTPRRWRRVSGSSWPLVTMASRSGGARHSRGRQVISTSGSPGEHGSPQADLRVLTEVVLERKTFPRRGQTSAAAFPMHRGHHRHHRRDTRDRSWPVSGAGLLHGRPCRRGPDPSALPRYPTIPIRSGRRRYGIRPGAFPPGLMETKRPEQTRRQALTHAATGPGPHLPGGKRRPSWQGERFCCGVHVPDRSVRPDQRFRIDQEARLTRAASPFGALVTTRQSARPSVRRTQFRRAFERARHPLTRLAPRSAPFRFQGIVSDPPIDPILIPGTPREPNDRLRHVRPPVSTIIRSGAFSCASCRSAGCDCVLSGAAVHPFTSMCGAGQASSSCP